MIEVRLNRTVLHHVSENRWGRRYALHRQRVAKQTAYFPQNPTFHADARVTSPRGNARHSDTVAPERRANTVSFCITPTSHPRPGGAA